MSPQLEEARRFLRMAQADFSAFNILATHNAAPAIALFHAQQAAEKSLKAILCLHSIEFRRTHDLELLANLLLPAAACPVPQSDFRLLTPYAVEFRYDDEGASLLSTAQAHDIANATLAWAGSAVNDTPTK